MTEIRGLLFDKDGTLFDFMATWGSWTRALLEGLAEGADTSPARLGAAIGYDTETGRFDRDSPVIAHTVAEIAEALLPYLPRLTHGELVDRMSVLSAEAPMVEAVPLRPLFAEFRRRGLRVGLATNDTEAPARVHLERAGVADLFDFVAGSDSGFGAKPSPGPLAAFARQVGLDVGDVAMVGDSRHDLVAGRAAGMRTVGVLTGLATEPDLAPLADVVLPDIGHLPGWMDSFPADQAVR